MNKEIANAATAPAPIAADGDTLVVAITTTAIAALDVYGKSSGNPEWWEIQADMDVAVDKMYVTIGAADVAAPLRTAVNGGADTQRSYRFTADGSLQVQFDGRRRFIRAVGFVVGAGTGAGFLRLHRVGVQFSQ